MARVFFAVGEWENLYEESVAIPPLAERGIIKNCFLVRAGVQPPPDQQILCPMEPAETPVKGVCRFPPETSPDATFFG